MGLSLMNDVDGLMRRTTLQMIWGRMNGRYVNSVSIITDSLPAGFRHFLTLRSLERSLPGPIMKNDMKCSNSLPRNNNTWR